jgi:hypothetical protein
VVEEHELLAPLVDEAMAVADRGVVGRGRPVAGMELAATVERVCARAGKLRGECDVARGHAMPDVAAAHVSAREMSAAEAVAAANGHATATQTMSAAESCAMAAAKRLEATKAAAVHAATAPASAAGSREGIVRRHQRRCEQGRQRH